MSTPEPSPVNSSLIHPLAVQDKERIDILYGGSEREVLKESIDLARDIMAHGLADDEQILYVNTLTSARAFEPHWRRALKDIRQNRRFNTITLLEQSLAQKLDFLKKVIEEKNIRFFILNGFEFATLTSRHRIQIFFWLKSLRDQYGASVIIFTHSGPRKYGTLGQMRFVSETCEEVGAYKREKEEPKPKIKPAPVPKTESQLLYEKCKKDENGEPIFNWDRQKLEMLREREAAEALAAESLALEAEENETLKNKELEVADVAS
jgi:hypothetical protein